GEAKRLWSGLDAAFPPAEVQPDVEELKRRFLHIQALEAARCLEEGVVLHPADADVGAVLGWNFPAYTGGPLSWIDMVGAERFVAECDRLADRYGERFRPTEALRQRARKQEASHPE